MVLKNLTPQEKSKILIEALPYIKRFTGKTVVIKYGGNAMINPELKQQVINDIILMKYVGIHPVIVHGGGPHINELLESINYESRFVQGLRVTDEKVMDIAQMVLIGKVNKEIVALLEKNGIKATGFSGIDGNTLLAKKKIVKEDGKELDLGFVGEVKEVNTKLIENAIENNFIPVIAPIGVDEEGNSYNINADYAAGSIAASLKAEKLFLLTDIDGVLDKDKKLISRVNRTLAEKLIEEGTIYGGMIPKIECCMEAIENGAASAHIINGTILHAILLEIFTDKGIGTMFEKEIVDYE